MEFKLDDIICYDDDDDDDFLNYEMFHVEVIIMINVVFTILPK
jgi:hypothetical protein